MMKKVLALLLALMIIVPAACAVTKNQIAEDLGMFSFDDLSLILSSEETEKDNLTQITLYPEDDVIYGGSDGYISEWFTSQGILSDANVDLNGDGTDEYLAIYTVVDDEVHYDPILRLRIYARDGGELVQKGDFPLPWFFGYASSEALVRIVPQDRGALILGCCISFWDGGSNGATTVLYEYDEEECSAVFYGSADNYGEYFVIENVRHHETLEEILIDGVHSPDPTETSDETYVYYGWNNKLEDPTPEDPYNYVPLEMLDEHLRKFGLDLEVIGEYGGLKTGGISGGEEIFHFACAESEYAFVFRFAEAQPTADDYFLSDAPDHEIIPDSDTRKLTRAELSGGDSELLGYIRNEILARHGYPFTKEKYQTYFGGKSWYEINEEFSFGDLSDVENANVKLIQSLE